MREEKEKREEEKKKSVASFACMKTPGNQSIAGTYPDIIDITKLHHFMQDAMRPRVGAETANYRS